MSRPTAPPRLGKAVRRLLLLLAFVVLVLAALPTIVAKTELRNRLLAWAVPRKSGSITCRHASLGWFTPLAIGELEVRDADGKTMLTASTIQWDRSLWDLLRSTRQLGTIEVESPRVHVRIRPDGSNVEDFLAALKDPGASDDETSLSLTGMSPDNQLRFRVVEGTVVSEDLASGHSWRTEGIHGEYNASADGATPAEVTVSGRITSGLPGAPAARAAEQPAAGTFALRLASIEGGQQRLDIDVQGVPLAAFAPWLRRYVNDPMLGGLLTTQGSAVWSPAPSDSSAGMLPPAFRSAGQFSIDHFDFAIPQFQGDRIRVERVEAPWDLVSEGQRLVINDLAIHSPLGHLAARGEVDALALASEVDANGLERHDIEVRGRLDLAPLAAMLPHAMRVREGTTITGGDVSLAVRSRPVAGGGRLAGSVEAARLTATQSGRALRWEAPIRATFDAHWQQDRWRIDSLQCQSDFCEITASGDLRQMQANGRFDLDRLAEQLGQFFDLSAWQPSGSGTAQLTFSTTLDQRFVADGEFRLQEFVLASGARNVWSEPQLTIVTRSAGVVDAASGWPRKVDSAVLQLRAEGDSLDAALTQPVDLAEPATTWPLSVRATGDLSRWLARTRPLVGAVRWELAGDMDVQATMRLGTELLEITNSQVRLSRVRGTAPGWRIDEPRIELSGDILWNRAAGRFASRDAQFVSSSASMAARNVQIALATGQPATATGQLALRADLARIAAMCEAPDSRPPWRATGLLTGNLEFTSRGEQLITRLNLEGSDLSLSEPGGDVGQIVYTTIWQEPQLTTTGRLSYSTAQDRLALEEFRVSSQTIALVTGGAIDRFSSERQVQLQGTIDYDLAQVGQLLKPYVGETIALKGQEQARFQLSGSVPAAARADGATNRLAASRSASSSHWSQTLRGKLEAPWQGADVFGLPIGPGQVTAHLGQGGVRFEPLALAVGQGRLDLAPYVQLDPAPQEITVARGQILSNVYVSHDVSDAMLKYIAPVLADATRSSGTFSMRLDDGRVPLEEPAAAEITGALRLQGVEVLPGPSTEQWVSLAQRIENLVKNANPQALISQSPQAILRVPDRTIPYRVADGRVYHSDMEFYVGEVTVRSRGSVGFDQTLEMTLTVPILDKWVENRPALSGLQGKTVDIPVGGTLARPRVDAAALTALSGQLLRDAAQGAIGGEINKALNKLFGR